MAYCSLRLAARAIFIFILIFEPAIASDLSVQRRVFVCQSVRRAVMERNPKYGLATALARLQCGFKNNVDDVNQYIVSSLGYLLGQDADSAIFALPGYVRILVQFKAEIAPEVSDAVLARLRQLKIVEFLGGGTENQALLRWSSALILGENFPDATFDGVIGSALAMQAAENLQHAAQQTFLQGYSEVLSPTYELAQIVAWLNVYDLSRNSRLRRIASATLNLHLAFIGQNELDGIFLAPLNRQAHRQVNNSLPRDVVGRPNSFYAEWFYLKLQIEVPENDFVSGTDNIVWAEFLAASNWKPKEELLRALGQLKLPYVLRSSTPSFGTNFQGSRGTSLRYVYVSSEFAMGSVVYDLSPADGLTLFDSVDFQITWHSKGDNSLYCYNSYWRGNQGWELPNGGMSSPFMRSVQDGPDAVLMLRTPKDNVDPYSNLGEQRFVALRSKLNEKVSPHLYCRWPTKDIVLVQDERTLILYTDSAMIVLRPFGVERRNLATRFLDGDEVTILDIATHDGGVMIDVIPAGSEVDKRRVLKKIDKLPMAFEPKSSNLRALTLGNKSFEVSYGKAIGEPVESRQLLTMTGSINGAALNRDEWPLLESPGFLLKGGVLRFGDGNQEAIAVP